jgi:hypothetical protein
LEPALSILDPLGVVPHGVCGMRRIRSADEGWRSHQRLHVLQTSLMLNVVIRKRFAVNTGTSVHAMEQREKSLARAA